jgi:hypothetical protein
LVCEAPEELDELEPPQAATPRERTPTATRLFRIVCFIA